LGPCKGKSRGVASLWGEVGLPDVLVPLRNKQLVRKKMIENLVWIRENSVELRVYHFPLGVEYRAH